MLVRESIDQKTDLSTKTGADIVFENGDTAVRQTAAKAQSWLTLISVDLEKRTLSKVCRHSVAAHDAISCDRYLIAQRSVVTSDRHFFSLWWPV